MNTASEEAEILLTHMKERWRYADDRARVHGVHDCTVPTLACNWKRQDRRCKCSICTCKSRAASRAELRRYAGRWVCASCCRHTRWWWGVGRDGFRGEDGVCGGGDEMCTWDWQPFVGCHSAGLGTKTCLQALTLHSSAYGRLMVRTRCPRARYEVFVEALTST